MFLQTHKVRFETRTLVIRMTAPWKIFREQKKIFSNIYNRFLYISIGTQTRPIQITTSFESRNINYRCRFNVQCVEHPNGNGSLCTANDRMQLFSKEIMNKRWHLINRLELVLFLCSLFLLRWRFVVENPFAHITCTQSKIQTLNQTETDCSSREREPGDENAYVPLTTNTRNKYHFSNLIHMQINARNAPLIQRAI